MISLLKKFIKIKIKFIKPRNTEVLIYDRPSLQNAELLFNKSTFEILDKRYESLNIYVLTKAILKYGITNIKKNYIRTFFELVSPKIIYTSIDNNPAFFFLKQIYNKAQYIADQGSMRDNAFYYSSIELIKKKCHGEMMKIYIIFGYQKLCYNKHKFLLLSLIIKNG